MVAGLGGASDHAFLQGLPTKNIAHGIIFFFLQISHFEPQKLT